MKTTKQARLEGYASAARTFAACAHGLLAEHPDDSGRVDLLHAYAIEMEERAVRLLAMLDEEAP